MSSLAPRPSQVRFSHSPPTPPSHQSHPPPCSGVHLQKWRAKLSRSISRRRDHLLQDVAQLATLRAAERNRAAHYQSRMTFPRKLSHEPPQTGDYFRKRGPAGGNRTADSCSCSGFCKFLYEDATPIQTQKEKKGSFLRGSS